MRVANVVAGLASVGDVDLFCTVSERPDLRGDAAAPPAPVSRTHVDHRAAYRPTARDFPHWLRSRQPRAIACRDWATPKAVLAQWAEPPYDVVWYSSCNTWTMLGDIVPGASVVDFIDLEDVKLQSVLQLRSQFGPTTAGLPLRARARRLVVDWMDHMDVVRWRRVQRRAAADAGAVVVCSELDRDRLGAPVAVVIPNGYDLPASDAAPGVEPSAPRLTMIGLMTYAPNADGARYFARDVLPAVRARVPEASFSVVGRHDGTLDDISGLPGVDVVGPVDDVEPVLRGTAAVVVPLRAGGGTRLKVLEAWAHALPVASTSLGCEGLGASPGVDLLIGDTAADLASACAQLLTDAGTASTVADHGRRRWEEHFRWDGIRDQIGALVQRVATA
jgi:glycosyltransferase involved in cell wall biosynthesis